MSIITAPGVTEFLDLADAPHSYSGQATKVVKVNAGETAVEFGEASGGGSQDSFGLVVDGGDSAITTGSKGTRYIPFNCTITGWSIQSDVSGDVVVDVKRSGVSLAGTEKPTLSSSSTNSDLALSTWTTSLLTGDIVEFIVDSASTVTRVTLTILITKI